MNLSNKKREMPKLKLKDIFIFTKHDEYISLQLMSSDVIDEFIIQWEREENELVHNSNNDTAA